MRARIQAFVAGVTCFLAFLLSGCGGAGISSGGGSVPDFDLSVFPAWGSVAQGSTSLAVIVGVT